MGIDNRIEQMQEAEHDISHPATSDVLLTLLSALGLSIMLPIRSSATSIGEVSTAITYFVMIVLSLAFAGLAVSKWAVSQCGIVPWLVIPIPFFYTYFRYGSFGVFWVSWLMIVLMINLWFIWQNYANNNIRTDQIKNRGESTDLTIKSDLARFVLILIAGVIIYRTADFLSPIMAQSGRIWTLAPVVGFAVTGYAVIQQIGYENHRGVSWGIAVSIVFWISAAFFGNPEAREFGTDAILFLQYSIDLVLSGQNPYTNSMAPAFNIYDIDTRYLTYRVDGTTVTSYSYPAGAILIYAVGDALGVSNINFISLAFFIATLSFLILESRGALAIVAAATLLASPEYLMFSSGGVFDITYVFFLLIGMRFWANESYRLSAFFVGISFTIKQIPWLIGPFLAIWLYKSSPDSTVFRKRVRDTLLFGFGGFLLPNVPFILLSPIEWLGGTLTPVAGGASLTTQGSGLSSLVTYGLYYLPQDYFTAMIIIILTVSLVLYTLHFEHLKWMAWILPAFIYFFHYRSFLSYFVYAPIIAYYAVVLRYQLNRESNARESIESLREYVNT